MGNRIAGLALVESIAKCKISNEVSMELVKGIFEKVRPYVERPISPSGDRPYETDKIHRTFPLMELAKATCITANGALIRAPPIYEGYNNNAEELYIYNKSMSVRVTIPFWKRGCDIGLTNARKDFITIGGITLDDYSKIWRLRTLSVTIPEALVLRHNEVMLNEFSIREKMLGIFDPQTYMHKFLFEPFDEILQMKEWHDTWTRPERMHDCVDSLLMEYYGIMTAVKR